MTRNISILGSTGSIGTQTLDVCRRLGIAVSALSAGKNVRLLAEQAREFQPEIVAIMDPAKKSELQQALAGTGARVVTGAQGLAEAATVPGADTVLTAVVGTVGLVPTMKAIEAGKNIALANKETLVAAGEIVMAAARKKGVLILPVDSEHSAIFQCLCGGRSGEVSRILLTASGGPFFGKTRKELAAVAAADALRHPNWSMGPKITVDSATLANKGLEFIEAMHLFSVPPEKIEILIHRQSIIHSMVEFEDGSVIAQLSAPDMRLAIQYALTFNERKRGPVRKLDFTELAPLTFHKPDEKSFGALALFKEAAVRGGTLPAALNAANEEAVGLFLEKKIGFLDIERAIEEVAGVHRNEPAQSIEQILEADGAARRAVKEMFAKGRFNGLG